MLVTLVWLDILGYRGKAGGTVADEKGNGQWQRNHHFHVGGWQEAEVGGGLQCGWSPAKMRGMPRGHMAVQQMAGVSLLYSNKYKEMDIVSPLSQTEEKVFKCGFCLNCSYN